MQCGKFCLETEEGFQGCDVQGSGLVGGRFVKILEGLGPKVFFLWRVILCADSFMNLLATCSVL